MERDRPVESAAAAAAAATSASAKTKSSHLDDPALLPFLSSSFDHTRYLNSALPALAITAPSQASKQPGHASLAELSAQTQTLLSQLSANTARLSNTLTQLADDIVRIGSRLGYEVEVLRGDALSLSEALVEGLSADIRQFVPKGLEAEIAPDGDTSPVLTKGAKEAVPEISDTPQEETAVPNGLEPGVPPEISQLRTLTTVRDRLESVVKVFGEAMEWTLPPSGISVTSSFISVSAPDSGPDGHTQEEKGQAVAKKLKQEIVDLLSAESHDGRGVEAAQQRVQQLRELAKVWKGTAEEKARIRFVEGLAKLVEDKQRLSRREAGEKGSHEHGAPRTRTMSPSKSRQARTTSEENTLATDAGQMGSSTKQGGYGFIDHLQRIRGGL